MVQTLPNPVVPVSVTVTTNPDGTVDIQCNPNPVPVNAFDTLITFFLETRGWRFQTINAVKVADPVPADFPYPSWTALPHLCVLYDKCATQDIFKYSVNVINTITDEAYTFDPEIRNGDGAGGTSGP